MKCPFAKAEYLLRSCYHIESTLSLSRAGGLGRQAPSFGTARMCLVGLLVRLIVLHLMRTYSTRTSASATSSKSLCSSAAIIVVIMMVIARTSGTATTTLVMLRVIVIVLLGGGISQPTATGGRMEGRSNGVAVAATTGRLTVIFGVACISVSTCTVLLIVARILKMKEGGIKHSGSAAHV
uniref:Uncharacterized protein n=1 Tax=Anopheles culicifacies TaxID=139723 RepID=A0A182M7Y6_9DIPT